MVSRYSRPRAHARRFHRGGRGSEWRIGELSVQGRVESPVKSVLTEDDFGNIQQQVKHRPHLPCGAAFSPGLPPRKGSASDPLKGKRRGGLFLAMSELLVERMCSMCVRAMQRGWANDRSG